MLTLYDVYGITFSSTHIEGVIVDISTYTSFKEPWQEEYKDNMSELDLAFYMRYGKRNVSCVIKQMAESNDDYRLSADHRRYIANMLYQIYKDKWQKEWDTRSLEYKPLENYNMTESGSDKTTGSGNALDKVYGYNSTDPVDNGQTESSSESAFEHSLTRSGNIGVTTSQQMLKAEREVWMWDYFLQVVFPDIAKFLTIPFYK